jgi:thiol:disulfide interchange protein DsbD
MAAAYASLGLATAWLGRHLQVALQTPLALGLMATAFAALALSMFGLFGIQAPRWLRNRAGSARPAAGGSVLGATFLGFSSALIVGPCVTPPLAAALLYVAQTGDVLRGALALFALGLGMGAPLVLVGTFGAGILPRSGPWRVRAKHAFSFVFPALAVSLITRLLPDGLSLLLWGRSPSASGYRSPRWPRAASRRVWAERRGSWPSLTAAP